MPATIQTIQKPTRARALDTSTSKHVISGNLVANGDFASGDLTGWDPVSVGGGETAPAFDANDGVGGSGCCIIDVEDDGYIGIVSATTTFEDGKIYRISLSAKVESGTGRQFRVVSHGDANNDPVLYNDGESARTLTTSHQVFEWEFTANADSDKLHIVRQGDGNPSGADDYEFYVDDIEVYELESFGNNNHGQIYSGRALEFDGVSDYLDLGANITIVDNSAETTQANKAWTVVCWVNIDSTETSDANNIRNIIGTTGSISASYISINDNEKLAIWDVGGTAWRVSDTALKINTWYRVAFVYDGDTTVTFYVNGVADGTGEITNTTTHADLIFQYIGQRHSVTRLMQGKMSDLQCWQGAFTAEDATYDYLNPEQLALNRGGTSLTNSNLKAWYPMNDGHRGQQSYILDASNTGLGDELLTNGDFSDTTSTDTTSAALTGWTNGGTHDSSNKFTISDGQLTCTTDGTDSYLTSTSSLTVGVTYKLTLDYVSGDADVRWYSGSSLESISTVGTHTIYYTAVNTNIVIDNGSSGTFTIDNVSVKSVNNKNHATTVFYGDEQITDSKNRDFASASDWTSYGSPTTFTDDGSGRLTVVTAGDGGNEGCQLALSLIDGTGGAHPIVAGRTYRVSVLLDNTAGKATPDINISIGGYAMNIIRTSDDNLDGTIDTTEQAYYADITTTNNSSALLIYQADADNDATTTFTIDDVSVKEVGTAMGWTDADQQLDIPQTALQSYNQLAMFTGLDSSDNYVQINPSTNIFNATNGQWNTVSFWFNCTDWDKDNQMIWRTDNDQPTCWLKSNGDFGFNTANSDIFGVELTVANYRHKWTHVVMAWKRNSGASTLSSSDAEMWINGEKQTLSYVFGSSSNALDTTAQNDIFFGDYSTSAYEYRGFITEFSLFQDQLTTAEVGELYNDGKALDAQLCSNGNLSGYWRNNGLSTWSNILTPGTNDGDVSNASFTETMLITAGADGSRDSQGFLMNRQKDTNALNLHDVTEAGGMHVVVPNNPTLQFGSGGSVAFWMKPIGTPGSSGYCILNNGAGGSRNPRITLNSTNKIRLFWEEADGTNQDTYAGNALTTGVWTYVTCTWNGTTNKIYYNDALDTTESESGTPDTDTADLYIGIDQTLTDGHFEGQIDELVFYSDVLELAEVKRNYNAGKRSHR